MNDPALLVPARYQPQRHGRGRKLSKSIHQWAETMGHPLLPWQSHVVDVGARTHLGLPAWRDLVVSVPRQQGKTILAKSWLAAWADTYPGSFMGATAQTLKDARLHLMDLGYALIEAGLEMKMNEGVGNELLRWPNGSELRISSPNRKGFHGWSLDFLLIDEAWAVEEHLLAGAIPARAARPASQMLVISTAGILGDSPVLERMVTTGREAQSDSLGYFEWSCGDLDPFDDGTWPLFMPAYGDTVDAAAILAAREVMPPHEFRRAFGNDWTESFEEVISQAAWQAAQVPTLLPGQEVAVAVDVSVDPLAVSIAAAWHLEDGTPAVELVIHAPGAGSSWIPDRIAELARHRQVRAIVSTSGQPARVIEADLHAMADRWGIPFRKMTQGDLASASMRLEEAVRAQAIAVAPSEALDLAVATAVRKPMGDMWRFDRPRGKDASPLYAVSTALLGIDEYQLQRVVPAIF